MNYGAGTRAGCLKEQGCCPYKCCGIQKPKTRAKARAGIKDEDLGEPFYAGHPLDFRAAR